MAGFDEVRGRIRDEVDGPRNPREGTARALDDGVVDSLRAGDLVAARACAEALGTLVAELANGLGHDGPDARHGVEDLAVARRRRQNESD